MLAPFALVSRPLQPRRLALGLLVCALALLALPAAARAQAEFNVVPNPPAPDQEVNFEATGIDPAADVTWDFDDPPSQPVVGQNVTHTFDDVGTYDVTMTVAGEAPVTKQVHVTNPPIAAFSFSPTVPEPGADVQFSADGSSDPDGNDPLTYSWDFGDGTPAGSGAEPSHPFSSPGTYQVVLTVMDALGAAATATKTVVIPGLTITGPSTVPTTGTVVTLSASCIPVSSCDVSWEFDGDDDFDDATGQTVLTSFQQAGSHLIEARTANAEDDLVLRVNAPPVAGFVWSPSSPLAGSSVGLISTSVDVEGPVSHAWELDGDGDFNDATTATISATFAAGTRSVSLRVTDGDGVSRTVTRQITVVAPSSAPPPIQPTAPTPTPTLRVLSPVVRLAGTVLPRGTRVSVLSVRAPRGAVVTVRCTGRGCPIRSQRKRSRTGFVRFRDMEALLRPRARVEVLVQAAGAIGRYTRFTIRAGKRPRRIDLCLPPGSSRPRETCDG